MSQAGTQVIRVTAAFVVVLFCVSVAHSKETLRLKINGDLANTEVRSALTIIAKGDAARFPQIASRKGIVVVRRSYDWKRSEGKKETGSVQGLGVIQEPRSSAGYLYLGGQRAAVQVEEEISFRKNELTSKQFGLLREQFAKFVSRSDSDF